MTRRPSLLVGAALALALGGLVLVQCSGGGGDAADDSAGGADAVSQTDAGNPSDTGSPSTDTGNAGTPDVPCVPSCEGRECGDDGCGGQCAPGCDANAACMPGGACCTPDCAGRECGSDGCGGTCGACGLGHGCDGNNGTCVVAGGLSCPAYFVCVDACASGDDACATGCRDATDEAAAPAVDALGPCVGTNCGECTDLPCRQACAATNCGQDYTDCFVGAESCGVVYACVNGCLIDFLYATPQFAACRADCAASGTAEAQGDYLDLETCVIQEGHCDPADRSDWEGCEGRARHTTCAAESGDCPQI